MNSSGPQRLKYSRNLRLSGVAASTVILASGVASGAVSVVNVDHSMLSTSDSVSFNPLSTDFTTSFNSTYSAGIRNCGFNLMVFSDPNFEWADTILGEGSVVGDSLTFITPSAQGFKAYPAIGEVQFAGYRMINQGPGNDETYYGYAKVTGVTANGFQFDEYAFETSPETFVTTPVPEPSPALLSVLSVGMMLIGRRKR